MRVAYVLGTSAGGTERHVRMLADGLARRGVTVAVYGPAGTRTAYGAASADLLDDAAPPRSSAEARDGPDPARSSAEAHASPARSRGSAEAHDGAARSCSSAEVRDGPDPARCAAVDFAAVEIADRPRPSRDLAAVRRLRALLSSSPPDVVHAHGLRAGALAALAIGRRGAAARDRGSRDRARPGLVVTVHNAAPAGAPAAAVYRLLERVVAGRADAVLCVSADLESRMRGLGALRVARAVVPAPPAPPRASAEALAGLRAALGIAGDPARTPVILTVARLAPQKGLGTLIEAAGRWRDRDPAPLLVIAGTGPLQAELARRAEASGAKVRFLGQRGDVPALLAAADVVVLPSVWEGQPLVVQEALRAGRPLVASRAGGIPDLTGEDAALLIPPGDPGALSAAVLSVLDDPALSAGLSQAAARRSAQLPGEQDALDAAMAAYQRVAPA